MSKHETPLTRRFWQELGAGTLVHEFQAIRRTSEQGNREIDGVIILATALQEVTGKERGPWQSVEGKDVICVQTKAARLSVHLIGQAYFSQLLLLRYGGARSVRTVAVCTADDAVLGPIARGLGIEVFVIDGEAKGGTSLKHTPSWVSRWHADLGKGALYKNLRVVSRADDRGHRSVYAVIDLDGPAGENSGRGGVDLEGHDVVAITTTTKGPGMYSVGEALVNRILLTQQTGARAVRSVVLCGKNDSVMDPLAAEHDIEVVVMAAAEAGIVASMSNTLIQDPKIEPSGDEPVTSAEELLERYAAGEREFNRARLSGANLESAVLRDADFIGADLSGACLVNADLLRADFFYADLTDCDLRGASLHNANLVECSLLRANLSGASLAWADLKRADLTGADLRVSSFEEAKLGNVDLSAARLPSLGESDRYQGLPTIGVDTIYRTSAGLTQRPGRQSEVEAFLEDCGVELKGLPWRRDERPGLTLFFSTKLTPLDQHIINGIIYGTVGFDRCEMVQFDKRGEGALVRLEGELADLVTVAEILHQRVWEQQEQAQQATVRMLAQQAQITIRPEHLTATADKVEKMELRVEPGTLTPVTIDEIVQQVAELLGPDAIEMLHDQGAKHVRDKDSGSMMTWGQKTGRALGKTLLKKVTGGVSKEIEGVVKDAVKALADDGED